LADRGGWLDCSQPDSRRRHRLAQHSEPIRFLRGRGRWQTTKIVKRCHASEYSQPRHRSATGPAPQAERLCCRRSLSSTGFQPVTEVRTFLGNHSNVPACGARSWLSSIVPLIESVEKIPLLRTPLRPLARSVAGEGRVRVQGSFSDSADAHAKQCQH
jgi:hypothetical protein